METKGIENLLEKVSVISKKYEEIAKITGENYNVFNILNLSTKEVRTHSAFIADLLNINSLHGQGNVFLKLFYKHLKENAVIENVEIKIPSKEAIVYVEENIGKVSGDEGGRIDIVIKDNNNQIVIENKINAGDQYKQLVRYNNKYPDAVLLYLTLDKQEASSKSVTKENGVTLKLNEDYFNITYKKDIIEWLELCKEKTVNQPILRETLTQYINLIKQLTNQSINKKMEADIYKLVTTSEIFRSMVDVSNLLPLIKKQMATDFWKLVKEYIKNELKNSNFIVKFEKEDFVIKKENWKHYDVRLRNFRGGGVHFGISNLSKVYGNNKHKKTAEFKSEFLGTKMDSKEDEWWISYSWLNEDFNDTELLQKALFNEKDSLIKEKALFLLDFVIKHQDMIDEYNNL